LRAANGDLPLHLADMDHIESLELSVVVVVLAGGHHLVRCLEALRAQASPPSMELIVPHDDRIQESELPRQRFPAVNFLHMPGEHSYAQLRTAAISTCRGRLIALTEDQCIPPEKWCANVVAAHDGPHAAVGGPVEKFRPDRPLNWAIYLRELGSYMPPIAEGPATALTDCNVSYKRAALAAIQPVWAEAFHEPQVHGALRERGAGLWLSPALLTYQQRSLKLGPALAERYAFGRLYGGLRVGSVSMGKRLALIAASPLLPALLLFRVLSVVARKRRHIGACCAALPYLALFSLVWGWGEFVGYVTGKPGNSR
jgi:hypothetical protein